VHAAKVFVFGHLLLSENEHFRAHVFLFEKVK
jgi:hypothetical protein